MVSRFIVISLNILFQQHWIHASNKELFATLMPNVLKVLLVDGNVYARMGLLVMVKNAQVFKYKVTRVYIKFVYIIYKRRLYYYGKATYIS